MKRLFAGGTCLAAVLAFGMVALAQEQQPPSQPSQPATQPPTSTQQPTTPPSQPEPSTPSTRQPARTSGSEQITIVGCVVKEADYRRSKNMAGGGAMGTGAGAGNEFILANASMSHGSSASDTTAGAPSATGTAGSTSSAAAGKDYELTGPGESQAESFVGKRVEVVGKLKAAEVGAAGTTGGATAGAPPSGVDVTSQDLRLREIEVTSVRETTGTCPSSGSVK